MNDSQGKITYFSAISGIALPERFTYPFLYEPHELAKIATLELQQYLESSTRPDHNFGLDDNEDGAVTGKMFGVLVVQDKEGKVGYLCAFSGKLARSNEHPKFVPPVFDMLAENSYFLKEQYLLNDINNRVKEIKADENYKALKQELEQATAESSTEIGTFKEEIQANKENRKKLRNEQKSLLSGNDYADFEAYMVKHSLHDKHRFNMLCDKWDKHLSEIKLRMAPFEDMIEALKTERQEKSAALQQHLFDQYSFLNKDGKTKSLWDIFSTTSNGRPPSAAGECATPKLLQYAFLNSYKPLAMAEFWWGASPKSEIRKHRQFYPACIGKCQPILAHMLEGIAMDEKPLH